MSFSFLVFFVQQHIAGAFFCYLPRDATPRSMDEWSPSTVPSLWPPPPLPPSQCTVYTDSVWLWDGGAGVLKRTVDHILLEFYTLFLTRFRTYKIASPPQTKMTSKDDIKGLVSLKFLPPCPTVSTQQLMIEDMCKICERFPNTAEKGLKKISKSTKPVKMLPYSESLFPSRHFDI